MTFQQSNGAVNGTHVANGMVIYIYIYVYIVRYSAPLNYLTQHIGTTYCFDIRNHTIFTTHHTLICIQQSI